jgi:PAS domain S-box-containing protein
MHGVVRFFLMPPSAQESHSAQLLHYVTNTIFFTLCLQTVTELAFGNWMAHHAIATSMGLVAALAARAALQAGRASLGAWGIVAFFWFASLGVLTQDGWRSPTATLFFLDVVIAAAVLGRRGVIAVGSMSLAAVLSAAVAEDAGQLIPAAPKTSGSLMVGWTTILGGCSGFLYLMVRQVERALLRSQLSEARFADLVREVPDAILTLAEDGRIIAVNPAAEEVTGFSEQELLETNFYAAPFFEDEGEENKFPSLDETSVDGTAARSAHVIVRRDGEHRNISINRRIVQGEAGSRLHLTIRDNTEQDRAEADKRDLEAQLRHAQRLESVGRLAGGVAHEFNNCLTVILASVDALDDESRISDEGRRDLVDIRKSAERAADVTSKLLAFGRERPRQSHRAEVNAIIQEIDTMLRRLVGESIAVKLSLTASPDTVRIDPNYIEQVIVNLAVNAMDAMPNGGKLAIETRSYDVRDGENDVATRLVLTVRDSGAGMSEEVRSRIFEPFFTTKDVGEGTGLGLSLVHGIVTQAGGHLEVASEPDGGTEFRIHLPTMAIASTRDAPAPVDVEVRGGKETILVVEDEPLVARAIRRVLAKAGYTVLVAADGEEATRVVQSETSRIDLLLTDVVLPGEQGPELAARLSETLTGVSVLFTSGYTAGVLQKRGIEADKLIRKPLVMDDLLVRVRHALDS